MRIRWTAPILLLTIILGASCYSDAPTGGGTGPTHKVAQNPFELHLGESVSLESEQLDVLFETFYSDSRCPSDVDCIWEGQAEIGLRVIDGITGDTSHIPLIRRPGRDPLTHYKDTLGLRFDFIEFDPYPISTVRIPDSERIATLAVFRNPPKDSVDGVVLLTNQSPEGILIDDYWLDSISIADDVLRMKIGYGGGCEEHDFALYMSPMAFFESAPLQADIYLRNDGHGDGCLAFVPKTLHFDLRPIAQLQQIQDGQTDCILLNVHGNGLTSQPEQTVQVLYRPSNGVPASWCNPDAK